MIRTAMKNEKRKIRRREKYRGSEYEKSYRGLNENFLYSHHEIHHFNNNIIIIYSMLFENEGIF